jgi:FtsH-binding integral membrane protein
MGLGLVVTGLVAYVVGTTPALYVPIFTTPLKWVVMLAPLGFVIAVVLAALISMGTFAHASRHGSSHATAWGIGAFLLAGVVVPLYFIRYWLRRRRRTD